jgi:hypothetical protein
MRCRASLHGQGDVWQGGVGMCQGGGEFVACA